MIFGRHDLIQDAPLSRIDLLACRNSLMYFNADTQAGILTQFHRALNPLGFSSWVRPRRSFPQERLPGGGPEARVFTKAPDPPGSPQLRLPSRRIEAAMDPERRPTAAESAFEEAPLAQIVIARDGRIALANQRGRRTVFALDTPDMGRPLQDLELSYRPVELRAGIEQAYADRWGVHLTARGVGRRPPGAPDLRGADQPAA